MSKSQPVGGSDGKVHTSPLVTKFSPKLPKIPCVYVWILIWNKALSIVRMVTSQIYSSAQPASSLHPQPQQYQGQRLSRGEEYHDSDGILKKDLSF